MKTLQVRNGDIAINTENGHLALVTGSQYLSQAVADALLTAYDGEWGSELDDMSKRVDANTAPILSQKIYETLYRLQEMQSTASVAVKGETMQSIRRVDVRRMANDKTAYAFYVEVVGDGSIHQMNLVPTALDHLQPLVTVEHT